MAAWKPPETYKPMPNLKAFLKGPAGARMHSGLFQMVVYLQWRTSPGSSRRSVEEAWKDLRMTKKQAREAIDEKVVLPEVYELVLARALGTG